MYKVLAPYHSILILLALLVSPLAAQLPNTTLYQVDLIKKSSGLSISGVKYLNNFNQSGYNNQVSFISADEIMFTANANDPDITDLYVANTRTLNLERLTANGLSEYSPNIMPGRDFYSCVRVETDLKTQLLWVYPKDLSNTGFSPIPDITNVGYYAWLDTELVALFLVGTPHELVVVNVNNGEKYKIIDKIGRCIKVNDMGEILFVHKLSDEQWFIKSYDLSTQKMSVICQTIPGSEDFELASNGNIFMASKAKIYEYNPSLTQSWAEILDFSSYDINDINRIAFRNNKLILVNNE